MNEYRLNDLEVGFTQNFSVTVTEEMLLAYYKITGDSSPIHINEQYAHELGFQGRVVYGMLTASFYSTLVGVYMPGKYALLQGVDSSFTNPVFIGDQLEISGQIIEKNETFKQIEIKANIKKKTGQLVSRAKIKVGIRE